MPQFCQYNIFQDLYESSIDGFSIDYNLQVAQAALATFGSPFSLIERKKNRLVTTDGIKVLEVSAANDNVIVVPTLVSISYIPSSTAGRDGTKGFQLFFGSSNTNVDEFLMKDIRFGNTKGDTTGTRWLTDDEMTIWACPHTRATSETPLQQGHIGTWPRVPADWVNQDKNNLHADAGKLFPHKIMSSLTANSQGLYGTNRQRELFIRSISGSITIPQIDIYGLVLPLAS